MKGKVMTVRHQKGILWQAELTFIHSC